MLPWVAPRQHKSIFKASNHGDRYYQFQTKLIIPPRRQLLETLLNADLKQLRGKLSSEQISNCFTVIFVKISRLRYLNCQKLLNTLSLATPIFTFSNQIHDLRDVVFKQGKELAMTGFEAYLE